MKLSRRKNPSSTPVGPWIPIAIALLVGALLGRLSLESGSSLESHPLLVGHEASSAMSGLARSSESFLTTVKYLYGKYGKEIADFRPEMRTWCQKTNSCKFTDLEAEMLYMLVREEKPQRVFEMAPNKGYSSHWILHALHLNDETSRLDSFDLHDASVKPMKDSFRARWKFTQGDYEELLAQGILDMSHYDFIFIDALHTEEFSRGYCQKILNRHAKRGTTVAIHDIVADELGGGRESAEVYRFMAFAATRISHVFTMSRYLMPSLNFPLEHAVQKINEIRASHGIIKPCQKGDCSDPLYDVLYFVNGDAPTIFFKLDPPL